MSWGVSAERSPSALIRTPRHRRIGILQRIGRLVFSRPPSDRSTTRGILGRTSSPTSDSLDGERGTRRSFEPGGGADEELDCGRARVDRSAHGAPAATESSSLSSVRSASGDVLGYAYWFKWQGQAYDLPRDGRYIGIFPDIQFLVNDTAGADAVISLSASEITPGASRTVQAGRLSFTLRFTAAEQTTYNGVIYVVEGSLAATLQVEAK